ncbi:hypothetical protein HPB51_002489 [Rhipicephalus microplus]|uniref:Uncharacterized protein n=1 Tax=Rhipicephalus microplus TaxID=6941 RepID=A0A9J6DEH6_RHIMP|nr:hypothetical protein HPB51_002489 [Rhipicephalus microplus]
MSVRSRLEIAERDKLVVPAYFSGSGHYKKDSSLDSLVQQHQAAVAAYTLEAKKLADESEAAITALLSSLLSTVQASQEQQAAQMAANLTNNQEQLQRLCQFLVVERMQSGQKKLQEMEKHHLALGEQVTSLCHLVSDEVSAHCKQQVHLVSSIREEFEKLRRELETSNEEVQRLSAAMEAKSTEAKKDMAVFKQQFEKFSRSFFEMEADQQDTMAKAQEAALDLSNIHKLVEESVSDAVASTGECFVEQKRAADYQMAACTTALSEAVRAGTDITRGQTDKAKTLVGNFDAIVSKSCGEFSSTGRHGSVKTAQVQDISEALRAGISNDMAKCSSVVSDFFQNDLQEYVPTGEHAYAKSFAEEYDEKLHSFQRFVLNLRRNNGYLLGQIGNADQTPLYFDMPGTTTVEKKGAKQVHVLTSVHGKTTVTAMLCYTSDGHKLRPYLIFK